MMNIVPAISLVHSLKEKVLIVMHKHLMVTLSILKFHLSFQYSLLTCISGVDLLETEYRFSVVYELLSLTFNSRLRVKIFLTALDQVVSVTNIYINANWWEREIWDLFGVFFFNHPDLRRILTDYGFEGHPMRKDFPLTGYVELKYDESR